MVTLLSGMGLVYGYGDGGGGGSGSGVAARAVDGVDFTLDRGELVCVIGPNGAGKSTLLKLLAGLRTPQVGAVTTGNGIPLTRLTDRERARHVAVVPQQLAALPDTTVEHFVEGGRYAHLRLFGGVTRADHAAVETALRATESTELRHRFLAELSGGERQRALVARALAQQSDAILCDEPTAALDLAHQIEVLELLARTTCDRRGVLVVTHDLNLASQFATRVVLLERGRVVANGAPADVLREDVLRHVYGDRIHCGTFPTRADGSAGSPLVVAWRGRGSRLDAPRPTREGD